MSFDSLMSLAHPAYASAKLLGFPAFQDHPKLSTPLNASPYIIDWTNFRADAELWPGRAHLVEALAAVRDEAESLGLRVEAMLLGGSFTELANLEPNDVDGLFVYRIPDGTELSFSDVADLQRRAKLKRADIRFIPADAGVLPLINAISYFTLLYAKSKTTDEIVRGLVLVAC